MTSVDASGDRLLACIRVETVGFGQSVDITDAVAQCLTAGRRCNGVAHVCIAGSTAAVLVMRYEPGTVADLGSVLHQVAPPERGWRHEAGTLDSNGSSHVCSELLGTSVAVPFIDRRLAMGDLHRIIVIDFDRRSSSRAVYVEM